jgi:hypothetical protein
LPEFHHDWLQPLPAPPASYFINAVMLFPNDEETREAYLQSEFAADVARSVQNRGSISGTIAHWLREAPREQDVISERRLNSICGSGQFAAWALCYVLQAVADGRPKMASIARAIDVAAAKPGARARETLDKDWKAYSSVAHLWLAFFAGLAGDFNPWGDLQGDWELLLYWLAFAEDLRRQGEAWKPQRAKTPVLDPAKTWRVPADFELPTINMRLRMYSADFPGPAPGSFQGAHIELEVLENILDLARG